MMLDAKSKVKRRLEREKEIEAVKAEVKELQEEEVRILKSLARRWKPNQRVSRPTRRQYSTVASPAAEYERYRDIASRSAEDRKHGESAVEPAPIPCAPFDLEEPEIPRMDPPHEFEQQDSDLNPMRMRAIQLLAMKMLGIRLLLRPSIAHSYGAISKNYRYDCPLPNLSVDELLAELEKLRKRLLQIKSSEDAHYADIAGEINLEEHAYLLKERDAATYQLRKLFDYYESGRLSVDGLTVRIAKMLISAKEPLSPRAVEILITNFSRARLNDVVKMVMDTLFRNTFLLTIPIIVSSLNWFNKTKNLSGFDNFLNTLQSPDPFVNIHLRWHVVNVGGIEVAVPPNSTPNPFILNALISCSLHFDQPQRADAWLDALRAIGFNDTVPILGAYLRYYSFQANWRKGRHVLMRVIFYLLSSKNHPVHEIERLVLYMIILCECCGKKHLSDSIIAAAVSSGIRWQASGSERDSRPALLWAVQKWRDASIYSVDGLNDLSPGEKYIEFARKIEPKIREAVEEFIPEDDLTVQRLRLEESFNMRYYKLISDYDNKPSRPPPSKIDNKSPRDEIESTMAELKKLKGMVSLQNAVIAKLEGYISSRPEMCEFRPQSEKNESQPREQAQHNMTKHQSRAFHRNIADDRYRLVSIFNRGKSASFPEEPGEEER
ncbi:hypothetical protein PRK78_006423 [Emydomyces testavorans]|uniref:Uncharacterized protein n=1 Tax=Emydomyces testavorans TaxID=2070801 RepID=A0AAF0DQ69_9EURO|nr:hypothetical protein PRK78_006423 [Emydomyces testavorans]